MARVRNLESLKVVDADSFIVGHTIKRCTQPAADAGDGGFDNNNSFGEQSGGNGWDNPAAASAAASATGGWNAPTAAPAAASASAQANSWAAPPAGQSASASAW